MAEDGVGEVASAADIAADWLVLEVRLLTADGPTVNLRRMTLPHSSTSKNLLASPSTATYLKEGFSHYSHRATNVLTQHICRLASCTQLLC